MLIILAINLLSNTEACSKTKNGGDIIIDEKAYEDAINAKTERIRFLEDLYDRNQVTLNEKEGIIKRKDDITNFYFNKWNETEEFRLKQQRDFIIVQEKMATEIKAKEASLKASDMLIDSIVELQSENRKFFAEVMNMMLRINDKQSELIMSAHETQKNTMSILKKVVEVSNRMHQELKSYGKSQKQLLNIVANMTQDEQNLWGMVSSLREAIAKLKEDQQDQITMIIEMESRKDETTRMVLTTMLDMITQDELWNNIEEDDLLENISKLELMR